MDFDLEDIVNLEQQFYDKGFKEGYDHGKIHGMIEGRALGQQKGYELWEELGFYEGFSICWKGLMMGKIYDTVGDRAVGELGKNALHKTNNDRVLSHIDQLLSLIEKFPTENPPNPSSTPNNVTSSLDNPKIPITPQVDSTSQGDEIDLTRQLAHIRSKYKLLCSALGVKPRLIPVPATTLEPSTTDTQLGEGPTLWGEEGKQAAAISETLNIELEEGDGTDLVKDGVVLPQSNRGLNRTKGGSKEVWGLRKDGQRKDFSLIPGSLSF